MNKFFTALFVVLNRLPSLRIGSFINVRLIFVTVSLLVGFGVAQAQVTLTATSGTNTTSGSFITLKEAFDAINAGAHQGTIVININASFTESASAVLNASGSGSASYTGISIYPTTTGLSISGELAAPLIDLNGADNVTIDGRVNGTGITKSLTISNTSTGSTAGTSTIRFINDASSNTIKYCTLKGSSTDAAAGIVFFSSGTTTGNDNNTIDNNDITNAADANRPLNAVYALGTVGNNNETNTISNNNIYNFLSKVAASNGINISSYNSAFTISGNSFYETASFAATASVAYNVILISAASGDGNGFTVSGNYIGGSAALCGGSVWTKTGFNNVFTAISLTTATGTANEIQGNTIQKFSWTNTSIAAFTVISLTGATLANIGTTTGNLIGAATGTVSITYTSGGAGGFFYGIQILSTEVVSCQNNTIGSITAAAANNSINSNFYGIEKQGAGNTTISGNTIGSRTTGNSIQASGSSTSQVQLVYGIVSSGTGTVIISGNTVANLTNNMGSIGTTNLGRINGILVSGGTNTITNNTVRNLTIRTANSSITHTASVSGIVMTSTTAAAQTVSGNTVYNLVNTRGSFTGGVIGIYYAGPTTASTVSRNFVHSLSIASSTTADIYGIKIASGATTYSNNIISLGGNTTTDIFGIFETGASNNNNSLYFNTVYVSGSPTSGTNTSYALYSAVNTNTRDFRNNVLVNARSTTGGSSLHYALYIPNTGGTLTCDYNNYFVSGTGGGVLGFFGSNKTTAAIVSGQTGNDANSISTNPSFVSTGTTASGYAPTVPGTGATGTGITVDYNGNSRPASVTMGAFSSSAWNGSTSTDWATTSNWTSGAAPVAGSIVNIPSGLTNYPILSTNVSIADLTLASSTSLNLSTFNLTLSGNLTNNGTISGSGTLELNGASAQQISGIGTVNNIKINNASGASIASGSNKLNVTGIYTPTSGVLTTNGNLVFRSTLTQEGVVGTAGTCPTEPISGNVTVEKYIPAKRAFRFITPGVTTSTTINANWQEGSSVNSTAGYPYAGGTTENPTSGYGTHIMGTGGSTNGFDLSISNSPSLFTFNASSYAWVAEANTNVSGNILQRGEAYRLFVRGDRGANLNTDTEDATATTIRTTGVLKVCESMSLTTTSPVVPLNSLAGRYSFIGNPFWSVVDWHAVTKTNIESNIYYWDPTQSGTNGRGAYITYNEVNGNNTVGSLADRYIQPGQAFFVRNLSTVDGSNLPSITFEHADIVGSSPTRTAIFGKNDISAGGEFGMFVQQRIRGNAPVAIEKIYVSLLIKNKVASGPADGFLVAYNQGFTDTYGKEDAGKFSNLDENITAVYNGSRQSILGLQSASGGKVKTDTIPISMTNLYDGEYLLKVSIDKSVSPVREVYVVNRVTKQQYKVDYTKGLELSFLNSITKTKDDLALVVNSQAILPPVRIRRELVVSPNPVTSGTIEVIVPNISGKNDMMNKPARIEVFSSNNQVVFTQNVTLDAAGKTSLDVSSLTSGGYVLRVYVDRNLFTTKLIKP
jgi:hypothetical protein